MRLFRLGYDLALHVYALAMLPKMCRRKYRSSFWAKLGGGFPKIEKDHRPLIWIHAVSLGETKAVAPLVRELKASARILLSTTTETGHAEGKRNVPADYHVYLPFDLPYLIRPVVKRVAPTLVLLMETDFWFNFQDAAQEAGAKLLLINGKLSERSFKRLSRWPFIVKHLIAPFDHYYVQGEVYRERFLKLGIPPSKITLAGNLKLDGLKPEPPATKPPYFILTLGSTHDPEERLWMEAIRGLPLKVYLVPRHPERFDSIAKALGQQGVSYGRYSEQASFETCQVILVDAMGVLKKCYQVSDLAFVGGSLTEKVGGHNLLEPSFFGVPVLYGPHLWGQPDLHDIVKRFGAGMQVESSHLREVVVELMEDGEKRAEMGRQGKQIFAESSGALSTVLGGVLNKLAQKSVLC